MKEKILFIIIGILLLFNIFTLINTPLKAQESSVALSAGEKGVVYFYDGANLWFSKDYGNKWSKIK